MWLQKILYQILFTILACISSYRPTYATTSGYDTSAYHHEHWIDRGFQLSHRSNLEAQQYFLDGAHYFISKHDTASYLRSVIELSDIKRRAGDFNGAFDLLSEIEYEAFRSSDHMVQMKLLIKYGTMYGIFGQDSLSVSYLRKSLEIAKQKATAQQTIQPYLSLAQQYVQMNEYDIALKFLDSCYLISESNKRLHFIDAYYGHIHTQRGDLIKAKIYLRDIRDYFEQGKPAFIVLVYDYLADLKYALNETDSAVYYWHKSIESIDALQAYIERKPALLEKLAQIHEYRGEYKKALEYIKTSKRLSDALFTTQSTQNKELFEIKRKFKKTLSRQEEQITAQQKVISIQSKQSFRLRVILGVLIVVTLLIFLWYRIRAKMRLMILEQEKADAVLEFKNKELTSNTLQLIEKEKSINEILDQVKVEAPTLYSSIKNKTKSSDHKIWEDFHRRFIQTNSAFYDKLNKSHPKLTQNDLKHCALIKLKFDSKEMSQILGISLHSVHMSRSRIRKKLGLERSDSLSGYLEGI